MASGHYVAAPWRSSGKTTLTVGLARAARHRHLNVQCFKKGPDYIDPQWLASASGCACYNLDPHLQTSDELTSTYTQHRTGANVTLVEGAQGLHDGLHDDCSDSNASIAQLLNLPVLLTFDARGMNRTLAALINGLQSFDPNVVYSGIIVNRVRSSRHFQKIDATIRQYTDFNLIGSLPESDDIALLEKNLGLVPALECNESQQIIEATADLLESNCDLDTLFADTVAGRSSNVAPINAELIVAATSAAETTAAQTRASEKIAAGITVTQTTFSETSHKFVCNEHRTQSDTIFTPNAASANRSLRIGLAYDEAFHFYYQDDLNVLHKRGVEIVKVSPLRDKFPDALDGLVIGGGFPERYAHKLSENIDFRQRLAHAVEQGLAVHAECAGLIYLCRSIRQNDDVFSMAGCINADVELLERPVGRGYMRLKACESENRPLPGSPAAVMTGLPTGSPSDSSTGLTEQGCLLAHEFHHSKVTFDTAPEFIYHVERGYGIDGCHDGVRINNVQATYAHFRHTSNTPWVDWLLGRISNGSTKIEQRQYV